MEFILLTGCASKPVPFSMGTLTLNATANYAQVSANQEPVIMPIDLYLAMARALKYNLEYRAASVEIKLNNTKLQLSHYSMLPQIAANAGYSARNNEQASSSFNVLTNTQNFGASTSQDKLLDTNDLAFSWNILDFGLSYVHARQAGDKYLIAQELKRKVRHKLLQDVRSTYWRAVSYKRLVTQLRRIASRTQKAYANSRALSDSGETSRVTALVSERKLLEIKRAIRQLRRDIVTAKAELASLIGLKPGTPFGRIGLHNPFFGPNATIRRSRFYKSRLTRLNVFSRFLVRSQVRNCSAR